MMHQKNAAILLLSLSSATASADLVPNHRFIPPERKDVETRLLQEVSFSAEEILSRMELMPIRNASEDFQESIWRAMLILDRAVETRVALLEVREKDLPAARKLKDYLIKYQGARPDALLITLRSDSDPVPQPGELVIHFADDAVARPGGAQDRVATNTDRVQTVQAGALPSGVASSASGSRAMDRWPSPFTGKARRARITESLLTESSSKNSSGGDVLSVSQAAALRADGTAPLISIHGEPGSKHPDYPWKPSRLGFEIVPEFASSETLRGSDLDSRATGVWLRTQFHASAEILNLPIFGMGPDVAYTRSLAAVSGEGRGLDWWDGFAGWQMNFRANSTRYWIPNLGASVGYGRMSRTGTGADRWISGYQGLEVRLDLNIPVDDGFQIALEGGYLTGSAGGSIGGNEKFRLVSLGGHLDQDLGIDVLGSPVRARMGASASLRGSANQQETVTTVLLGFSVGML